MPWCPYGHWETVALHDQEILAATLPERFSASHNGSESEWTPSLAMAKLSNTWRCGEVFLKTLLTNHVARWTSYLQLEILDCFLVCCSRSLGKLWFQSTKLSSCRKLLNLGSASKVRKASCYNGNEQCMRFSSAKSFSPVRIWVLLH